MNKIIKLKGSILAGVLNINECKIKIWKQASDCSLEGGRKMKKCQLVQNIRNFKFCYFIFCTIICFIVLSVPTFAKENSDNVIRVGSFEETYNTVNEKGERRVLVGDTSYSFIACQTCSQMLFMPATEGWPCCLSMSCKRMFGMP